MQLLFCEISLSEDLEVFVFFRARSRAINPSEILHHATCQMADLRS